MYGNLFLPKKKFRQITSLVQMLLSRNFCQKRVRVDFRNFHTVEREGGGSTYTVARPTHFSAYIQFKIQLIQHNAIQHTCTSA